MMYNETVMNAFKEAKHMGVVDNYNALGTVGNEVCGDIMQITLRIEDGVIKDAAFKTFGCVSAVATSSTATDMIIGKSIGYARSLTNDDVINALGGLPAQKIHCSVLAAEAINAALDDYEQRAKEGKQDVAPSVPDDKDVKYV